MYILTGCINSLIKKKLLKLINIQRCSYIQNPTANKQHITSLRSTNSPAFVSKKTGHLKWEREYNALIFVQKKIHSKPLHSSKSVAIEQHNTFFLHSCELLRTRKLN